MDKVMDVMDYVLKGELSSPTVLIVGDNRYAYDG